MSKSYCTPFDRTMHAFEDVTRKDKDRCIRYYTQHGYAVDVVDSNTVVPMVKREGLPFCYFLKHRSGRFDLCEPDLR